jgi:hypothetical protein
VLHIDDASTGQHTQALHKAAYGFWRTHLGAGESLYIVVADGTGRHGFRMSIRTHHDRQETPLLIDLGADPEGAILTALEEWWAKRP